MYVSLSTFLKRYVWNPKRLMLLDRSCSCAQSTCGYTNTKNSCSNDTSPGKGHAKFTATTNITVHQTVRACWNPRNKAVKVLATHSPRPSPLQEVDEMCVQRRGWVRKGDARSSGMLGQALQPCDDKYWDETRFRPWGTTQAPKLNPQHHLGVLHRHSHISRIVRS